MSLQIIGAKKKEKRFVKKVGIESKLKKKFISKKMF